MDMKLPLSSFPTLAARKKALAAPLVKQRSVAHSVQRRFDGDSSAPGGSSAAVTKGSSSAATWLDAVIRACPHHHNNFSASVQRRPVGDSNAPGRQQRGGD